MEVGSRSLLAWGGCGIEKAGRREKEQRGPGGLHGLDRGTSLMRRRIILGPYCILIFDSPTGGLFAPAGAACPTGGCGGVLRGVQGYLAHKKLPPACDHRRALGIGLP